MTDKPKLLPPVYFFSAIVVMVGLHFLMPLKAILSPPLNYVGALFMMLGFASTLWAVSAFGKAGTPFKPFERSTALVTHGLYRITRNPMYLGMVIALTGVAIWLGTISPFLVILIFVWLIQRKFVQREEKFLEDLFGHEYLAYKARVRRWL
jgi:protein-S-isoprenylcysteine O-methyltransferase Ste14